MKVTVIGQGYVGLALSLGAAKAGHKVVGFDISDVKIENLKKGLSHVEDNIESDLVSLQENGHLEFKYFLEDGFESEVFVIAVPTPLDSNSNPDLSMIKQACETIAKHVSPNNLIISESTSYIGTLRDLVSESINHLSKVPNILYAVAPERIDPGNSAWNLYNTPRFISGLSEEATLKTYNFYKSFCQDVSYVSKPETLEAAKLIENTFRLVNIAFVNDLIELSKKLNFSLTDAIRVASSKPFGFMPFYPSIGVGGHCIPIDPTYLRFSADSAGIALKSIENANLTNHLTPSRVANLIEAEYQSSVHGKRIQIAGIAYKSNSSDLRESPAIKLISELVGKGAIVSWHDPLVKDFGFQKSIPLDPSIDLGLIVSPHDGMDFSIWFNSGIKVFDLSPNSNNYGWPKFF